MGRDARGLNWLSKTTLEGGMYVHVEASPVCIVQSTLHFILATISLRNRTVFQVGSPDWNMNVLNIYDLYIHGRFHRSGTSRIFDTFYADLRNALAFQEGTFCTV